MGYRVSVPMISENVQRQGKEALLEQVRALDAERVFLSVGCYKTDAAARKSELAALKENCEYFHAQGLEVGVWLWTFMFEQPTQFTSLGFVKPEEMTSDTSACPLDENFLKFSGEYLQDLARCGVDLIMFDDDFRFGFRPGIACICELHRKRICARLGEEISRDELAKRIMEKPDNPYRDAWLAENGYSLENFARNARRYVDEVAPHVRMGFCACNNSWDLDGTDASVISKLLAGNTRPFIRLIGAPYWVENFSWGHSLQDVVELERMEASWIDPDIEIMAEGDVYPRPRVACPSAYLEGFDTAIRAAGCTDGILKYGIDYTASPRYERGYIEAHKRHRGLYEEIHEAFEGKTACGVRVYESKRKVARADSFDQELPDKALDYLMFSNAARLLAAHAIPTTYVGEGVCGIVFGESARDITAKERKGGLILDGSAAMILHEMGVDVGIEDFGKKFSPAVEYFIDEDEWVCTYVRRVFAHTFKKGIKVLSESRANSGISLLNGDEVNANVPMSYLYENADGERFLVINVDWRFPSKSKNDAFFRRQYARGRQLVQYIPWLSRGRSLPAACTGNPCVYMIAKEKDGALSVGLWNFFPDPVWDGVVELSHEYRELRLLNGVKGSMEGTRVTLEEISPYGFAGFEVSL